MPPHEIYTDLLSYLILMSHLCCLKEEPLWTLSASKHTSLELPHGKIPHAYVSEIFAPSSSQSERRSLDLK
jgi:hypothetical protein